MDRRVFLKVKLKSLAEEARIIKHEEAKRKVKRRPSIPAGVACEECAADREMDRANRAKQLARPWRSMALHELEQLRLHRIRVVRKEVRLTLIACGFIRGRALNRLDRCEALSPEDWKRIEAMAKKYGGSSKETTAQLAQWALANGIETFLDWDMEKTTFKVGLLTS